MTPLKLAWIQIRHALRDSILQFILLRSDLPETLSAYVKEIEKELNYEK